MKFRDNPASAPSNLELDRVIYTQWANSIYPGELNRELEPIHQSLGGEFEPQIREAWSEGCKKGIIEALKPEVERYKRNQAPAF